MSTNGNKVMNWEFKNQWVEERSLRELVVHTPKVDKVEHKKGIAASLRKNFCTGSVSGTGSQIFHKKEVRDKIIKTTMTLERVLQDDELMRALNHYVERTHTSENLHFWIDVEVYQNLYWKPMKTLGLYDTMMRKRQSQIRSFATFYNTRVRRLFVARNLRCLIRADIALLTTSLCHKSPPTAFD